ncbi:MAG TPA: phosphatidylglycerophosphatase A [Terriglobales bacterium]|nr:phosphatidylglycerophosphatase A [Terriglobales bacterium]
MKRIATFIATLGPVGSVPVAPATAGSAVVALVGYFLPSPPLAWLGVLFVAGTALAIWTAGAAEKILGHDAKPIVIDEAVGQSLALLLVPRAPAEFAASFVLFRIFDVWKPLGAREAQKLPGGWGVVADDVIAGVTACLAVHAIGWIARRLGLAF